VVPALQEAGRSDEGTLTVLLIAEIKIMLTQIKTGPEGGKNV